MVKTYRFQSRSQTLRKADVRVVAEVPDTEETTLLEELQRAGDSSEACQSLKKQLMKYAQSLPLLLYNHIQVVRLLLSAIPLLPKASFRLIRVLARELRSEFTPVFTTQILPQLIQTADNIDLLEPLFSEIALCLKYLIKSLPPIDALFNVISPFFTHHNEHVHRLSSQCFSYLLKKASDSSISTLLSLTSIDLSQLFYYACIGLHCERILSLLISHPKLIHKVVLQLAFSARYLEEIWKICTENRLFDILADWIRMCNYTRFPTNFDTKMRDFITKNENLTLAQYWFRARNNEIRLLPVLLSHKTNTEILDFVAIVSDFEDLHTEVEMHQWLIGKDMKNSFVELDFSEGRGKICEAIQENLTLPDISRGRKALGTLLWLQKRHNFLPLSLNIEPWLCHLSLPEDIWLCLRAANSIGQKLPTIPSAWYQISEEITTELAFMRPVESITAASIPAAARLGMKLPSAVLVMPYLAHPMLRKPALQLINSLSPGLELCWELVDQTTDLTTERHKFLTLKKLQLHTNDPYSEAIIEVLIGSYWDRFTTVWKYTTETLSKFAETHSDFTWRRILLTLQKPDFKEKSRFEVYNKLIDDIDFTPAGTYKECLLRYLSEFPSVVKTNLAEFVGLFEMFMMDYVTHFYVIGYTKPPENRENIDMLIKNANQRTEKRPELNRQLTFFLKVIKEIPDFSTISDYQIDNLYRFFLQLLLKKKQEIRILSLECILKLRSFPSDQIDLFRNLAKDDTFKSAVIDYTPTSDNPLLPAIFLCAARIYRKSNLHNSSISFLSKLPQIEYLAETLSVNIWEKADFVTLANCPVKRLAPILKAIEMFCGKLKNFIGGNVEGNIEFLLSVVNFVENWKKNENFREIFRLVIGSLNAILANFAEIIPKNVIFTVLNQLEKSIFSLEIDYRPKLLHFLYLLLSKFRYLVIEKPSLLTCFVSVLKREEIEGNMRNQGFGLILEYLDEEEYSQNVLSLTNSILEAIITKVKNTGVNEITLRLMEKMPISDKSRELADLLVPLAVRKHEIIDLLSIWLPQIPNFPLDFIVKNLQKQRRFVLIIAQLSPEPLKSLLRDLNATIRSGLEEIDDFTVQLEALYRLNDICLTLSTWEQGVIVSFMQHFIVKTELAKRTQAAKILIKLVQLKEMQENIVRELGKALRRCTEDEEVRTVFSVLQAYLDATGEIPTSYGDYTLLDSLCNLQVSSRIKALKKLCDLPLSPDLKSNIFLPIITYLIFNHIEGKQNHQAYIHALLLTLAKLVEGIPWKRYFNVLKAFSQRLNSAKDEKLLAKSVAVLLDNLSPELTETHQISLNYTILPSLKSHLIDRYDPKTPTIRRFIILAVFRYLTKLSPDNQQNELSRLVILLTRYMKHRDSKTRETAFDSVVELTKTGLLQSKLMIQLELHLSDDREILAKMMGKVLISIPFLTHETAKIAAKVFLEYDQSQAFYHLAKLIKYEDLPVILISMKPLQYIAKGISENTTISPIEMTCLGLDLLEQRSQKEGENNGKVTKKDATFSVQLGAANGTRPEVATTKKVVYSDKLFAFRLIKQGIHKAKNVPESMATRCLQACLEGLNHPGDEVVLTSLEVLRAFKSPLGLEKALILGETASGDVLIQCLKYLSVLLRSTSFPEQFEKRALILTEIGLQSEFSQSAALKLLRVFMEKSTMDPGIYDAMEQVPKLMLTNTTLRDSAASLYIEFLKSYPLSDQRRDFHIDFLIRNTEFPISSGRYSVAKAINLLLTQLPAEYLLKQYDFIMLSLITALANEDNTECRSEFEAALASVIRRNMQSAVLERVAKWVFDEREAMQKTALVTMRIELDVGKEIRDLKEIVENLVERREEISEEIRIHLLNFLEKALETNALLPTPDLIQGIQSIISDSIDCDRPVSLHILVQLNHLPLDLAKSILRYIARSGHILPHFEELLSMHPFEEIIPFASSLLRRQLGKNEHGSGTLYLVHVLAQVAKARNSSHLSLFKAVLVGGELAKTEEMKQAIGELFQVLHAGMGDEEFMKTYSETRTNIEQVRKEKRTALKQLIVSNPEA